MNKFKRLLSCALLLTLSACLTPGETQMYGTIDPTQKVMTVPPGDKGLVGAIKQRLARNGWKLYVDEGPVRAEEIANGNRKTTTAGVTYRSRYRLEVEQHFANDSCIGSGDPVVYYDLTLIDNSSGQEVLAQSGQSCTGLIADKFVQALSAPTPTP